MRCFIGLPTALPAVSLIKHVQRKAKEQDPLSRVVPQENFHLTLAFIGEVEKSLAIEIANKVKAMTDFTGTSWLVDQCGFFPKPKVAWISGPTTRELKQLCKEARQILDGLSVLYDKGTFKPHITILRKACLTDPVVFDPFEWPIQKAVLFQSTLSPEGRRIYSPINP